MISSVVSRCKNWLKGHDLILRCLYWPYGAWKNLSGLSTVDWVGTIMSFAPVWCKAFQRISNTDKSF